MKKRIFCLCAALMLLLGLCMTALAYDSAYVIDTMQLLSDSDGAQIDELCMEAENTYGCGVYVVTVDDYSLYYDAVSIEAFSEAVYEDLALGVGADRNGILLSLSMAERDFDLCAHGEIGNRAFTDYGKQWLQDQFLDNFQNDDWAGGLYDYAASCVSMLQQDAEGTPLDIGGGTEDDYEYQGGGSGINGVRVLVVVIVSLLTALIVCLILRSKMKTARRQSRADAYIPKDGIQMTREEDLYLTTTQTRTKIETENNSGGTTVNSNGYSHSSGKF